MKNHKLTPLSNKQRTKSLNSEKLSEKSLKYRDGGSCLERLEHSKRHLKVGMEFHMGNSIIILRGKKENNEVLVVSQVNNTVETRIT